MSEAPPDAVVFDLGGVLIDWDPRHLYRKIFDHEEEVEWFLANVCTTEWNQRQDEGRTWAEAVFERMRRFPDYADEIAAYDERWDEMLAGSIDGSVSLLERLDDTGIPLYGLTNWSAGKFVHTDRFSFMSRFRGVVVSGREGVRKPDPRIFRILADRYELEVGKTLFIDDVYENVEAARKLGFQVHLFASARALSQRLEGLGLLAG